MKKYVRTILVCVATLIILLLPAVPHHHHHGEACLLHELCDDDDDEASDAHAAHHDDGSHCIEHTLCTVTSPDSSGLHAPDFASATFPGTSAVQSPALFHSLFRAFSGETPLRLLSNNLLIYSLRAPPFCRVIC